MPRMCCWPGLSPGVPDHAGGAHDAPPDPLVCWGGGHPLPKNLTPIGAFDSLLVKHWHISFIWCLKVLEKSLNLILTNGQEPCTMNQMLCEIALIHWVVLSIHRVILKHKTIIVCVMTVISYISDCTSYHRCVIYFTIFLKWFVPQISVDFITRANMSPVYS